MRGEAAMLARCRDLHAAIAPGAWSLVHDGEGAMIEARGEMGELIPVARFTEFASEAETEFAVEAPRLVGFLLGLVDRAIRHASRGQSAARPSAGEAMHKDPPPRAGEGDHAQHGGGGDAPREGAESRRGGKDYAAQAAMACARPAFKKFLMERHGLESPATDERTAQRLRGLLGVTSRRELNDGGEATARWRALAREFEAWRKAG